MRSFSLRFSTVIGTILLGVAFASPAGAAIVSVRVTIENIGPANGVALTPFWVGFQSGNFDSYNSGAAAGRAVAGLERLAEDGTTSVISADFQAGMTYVNGAGVNAAGAATGSTAGRVDGTIVSASGPPPFTPGQSNFMDFLVDDGGANNFFSYASMVLPTNDFFIANGAPMAIDVSSILGSGGTIDLLVGAPGTVNDAGSEVEDFASSAANGLFAGRGLPGGQTGPNQGADDPTAFVRNVTSADPFAGFASGAGTNLTGFNFNDAALYTGGGIARITITAVPEPSSLALLMLGTIFFGSRRRRIR